MCQPQHSWNSNHIVSHSSPNGRCSTCSDERLLGVVGRDAARIHLDPRLREALIRRHGLQDMAAVAVQKYCPAMGLKSRCSDPSSGASRPDAAF